jgi:hypothetical protein
MAFLPNGDLIVGSGGSVVRRFDSQSGAYLGNFAAGGSFYAGVVYVPEPSVFAALFTAFPIAIWIQRQYKRQA